MRYNAEAEAEFIVAAAARQALGARGVEAAVAAEIAVDDALRDERLVRMLLREALAARVSRWCEAQDLGELVRD